MPKPQQQPNQPKRRYYFDREYLSQYIDQRVKLKVYVDGRFLSIADASDLEDDLHGVGYDNAGNAKFFDYRSINKIKAGSELLTLDQLQQQQSAPEEPEAPEGEPKPSSEEEPEAPEEPAEEEPEAPEEESKPKTPQKANYDMYDIGKNLIRESRRNRTRPDGSIVRIMSGYYANQSGIIISEHNSYYELRLLSGTLGRIFIDKEDVKFI